MSYIFIGIALWAAIIAGVATYGRSFGVATINLALFSLCTVMAGVCQ